MVPVFLFLTRVHHHRAYEVLGSCQNEKEATSGRCHHHVVCDHYTLDEFSKHCPNTYKQESSVTEIIVPEIMFFFVLIFLRNVVAHI